MRLFRPAYSIPALVMVLLCSSIGCGGKSKKRKSGDPGGPTTTQVRPNQAPQAPRILSEANVNIVAAETLPLLLIRKQVSIEEETGRGVFSFDFACEDGKQTEGGCGHFAIEDLAVGLGAVPGGNEQSLSMNECNDVAVASVGGRGSVYLNLLDEDPRVILSVADLASPSKLYDERYASLVLSVAKLGSEREPGACRYFRINIARPDPNL